MTINVYKIRFTKDEEMTDEACQKLHDIVDELMEDLQFNLNYSLKGLGVKVEVER